MIFSPDLAALITLGHKTVTRRRRDPGVPCRYVVGRSYAMQVARGGMAIERLIIDRVDATVAGDISRTDATREGFRSVGAFKRRWSELYGHFDAAQPVWRIEFHLDPHWPHPAPAEAEETTREETGSSES